MASWKFVKEKKLNCQQKCLWRDHAATLQNSLTTHRSLTDNTISKQWWYLKECRHMSSRTILLIHTYNSYYSIWKYVIGGDVVLFAFWRQSVCVCVCVCCLSDRLFGYSRILKRSELVCMHNTSVFLYVFYIL